MPVAASDFLDVARRLQAQAHEADARSAVSRAYYAAYHHSKGWSDRLPLQGRPGSSGGVHQRFIHMLRNPDPSLAPDVKKKSCMLAAKLEICKTRRRVADYELDEQMPPGEVSIQLQQVDKILADYA